MTRVGLSHTKLGLIELGLLLAAGFSFVTSCSQGEGDRCESDGDCSDGLICQGADRGVSGFCRAMNTSMLPDANVLLPGTSKPADASVVADVATAGSDSAVSDVAPSVADGALPLTEDGAPPTD